MEVTGADHPTGEGTGVRIMDTACPTLTLRTPDAGGTAGAGYAPEESSFTDALCQVVEESPLAAHAFQTQSTDLYALRLLEKPSEVQFTGNP
jgi:hypothetical protein